MCGAASNAFNAAKVASEAALDGLYVFRTSVADTDMSAEQAVLSYKRLAGVERAFRTLKVVDLQVRPIQYRLETRVRAHIFLSMLAYYVQWYMIQAWQPLTFATRWMRMNSATVIPWRRPSARKPRSRRSTPARCRTARRR